MVAMIVIVSGGDGFIIQTRRRRRRRRRRCRCVGGGRMQLAHKMLTGNRGRTGCEG